MTAENAPDRTWTPLQVARWVESWVDGASGAPQTVRLSALTPVQRGAALAVLEARGVELPKPPKRRRKRKKRKARRVVELPAGPLGEPRCRVSVCIGGERIRCIRKGTADQVTEWLRRKVELHEARQGGWLRKTTFAEMVTEFLAAKRAENCRPGYLRELDRTLGKLAERWAGRDPMEITPPEISAWIAESSRRVKPRTCAKFLRMLNTLFEWGKVEMLVKDNPCGAVKAPRADVEERRWLTASEFRKLYDAAPAALRPVLRVLVRLGVRAGELCALRRADVRPDGVHLARRKMRKFHVVECPPSIREVLLSQPARPDGLVFTREAGRRASDTWDVDRLGKAIARAARAAGLDGRVGTHCLRHTAGTWVTSWRGLDAARMLLGHSHSEVTERYSHARRMDWQEQGRWLPADLYTDWGLAKNCQMSQKRRGMAPEGGGRRVAADSAG